MSDNPSIHQKFFFFHFVAFINIFWNFTFAGPTLNQLRGGFFFLSFLTFLADFLQFLFFLSFLSLFPLNILPIFQFSHLFSSLTFWFPSPTSDASIINRSSCRHHSKPCQHYPSGVIRPLSGGYPWSCEP